MKFLSLPAFFFLLLSISQPLNAQNLDSLKSLIVDKTVADTTRALALTELSYALRRIVPDSSLLLGEQALELSEKINYPKGTGRAHRVIGIYHYLKMDYTKAFEWYKTALTLAQKTNDLLNIANCYNNIGTIYHARSDYAKAMEYFSNALSMRKKLGDQRGIIQCYNNLASVHHDQGNYENAKEYYSLSLTLCLKLGNKEGIATAYNNMGSLCKSLGQYEIALRYCTDALNLWREMGDKPGIIVSHHNLGDIHKDQGDYEKALEHLFNSLKLEEETGHRQGMAATFNSIGTIYKNQGNYEKALEHLQNSLGIKTELGNKRGIANTLYEIGALYQNQNISAKAEEYLLSSLKVHEEIGDKRGLALSRSKLAEVYINKTDLERALPHLKKGLALAEELNSSDLIAELFGKYAKYYNATKDYTSAFDAAQKAIALARKSGNVEYLRNALEQHYLAASILGKYNVAFTSFKEFIALRDSLQNEKSNRQILSKEFAFKEEKARIEQEKKELEFLAANEYQKRITYTFAGAAFALVIVSFLIYRGYRQKQKTNWLLTIQKEQTERANVELERLVTFKNRLLSIVSHDVRGPLNSLKGVLFLAQQNALSQNELKEVTARVGNQVSQVAYFLDNLLRWSQSHFDRAKPNPSQFKLRGMIQDTVELLSFATKNKKIEVATDVSEELTAFADEEMIKLVVRNLLSNSLKFCSEGDRIKVVAQQEQNKVSVSVEDTGVGIKGENLPLLFNETYLSTRGTKDEIGTGIGLSLCKEFVEKNHGSISVTSEEGKGSCFVFTIPGQA